MSPAQEKSECVRFDRWLTPYLDEELDAIHCLEVEDHLDVCPDCRDLVEGLRTTRNSLQRVCAVSAPSSLRERLAAKLAEERAKEVDSLEPHTAPTGLGTGELGAGELEGPVSTRDPGPSVRPAAQPQLVKLRWVVPMAAAATIALVFGAMRLKDAEQPTADAALSEIQENPADYPTVGLPVAAPTLDHLVEDLVAQHLHPPPPETTDPDGLSRFDPYLGIRVRRPQFRHVQAQYVGARMHQRAALLQYVVDRNRVTMYVFDPKKVPMRATHRLHHRQIGPDRVFVGELKGCTVAASEHNGIGYALASSSMKDDEAVQLLVQAAR